MSKCAEFDRYYAEKNAKIILAPSRSINTPEGTFINYHFVSELEDNPYRIRIREGRLEAMKPKVYRPVGMIQVFECGCNLKSDNYSERVVDGRLKDVVEKLKADIIASMDKSAALIVGEDDPWEAALLELVKREVSNLLMKR